MKRESVTKMVAAGWAALGYLHVNAAVNNDAYADNVLERIADFDERGIYGHFSTLTAQEEMYRSASDGYLDMFTVDGLMVVSSLMGGAVAARRNKQ